MSFDALFEARALTGAINTIKPPPSLVYDELFRAREHGEASDALQFDVITDSETVLRNLSTSAEAQITAKTGRKTVTMTAPRLAHKRVIRASDLNRVRAAGEKLRMESMKSRIAREQQSMKNTIYRTMEFWACNALKGKIYDADMSTVLVDFGLDSSHEITLTGTSLWTNAASKPIEKLRQWKKLIDDDAGATITRWVCFCGSAVMDAMMGHAEVLDLLKFQIGRQVAEDGRIGTLSGVKLIEYTGSFTDEAGDRRRFIGDDRLILVGVCDDVVDTPFAPVMDEDAPWGVGNTDPEGKPVMFFSKSKKEWDPSGRWILAEARPLPVLQRPGCVVHAKVV